MIDCKGSLFRTRQETGSLFLQIRGMRRACVRLPRDARRLFDSAAPGLRRTPPAWYGRRAGLPDLDRLLDLDLARAILGALRDSQREHAVLHLRLDAFRVELATEGEAAAITGAVSVRLRAVGRLYRALEQQRLAVDVHVQSLLRHARNVRVQRYPFRVFEYIDRGAQDRLGERRVLPIDAGAGQVAGHFRTDGHVKSPLSESRSGAAWRPRGAAH